MLNDLFHSDIRENVCDHKIKHNQTASITAYQDKAQQ